MVTESATPTDITATVTLNGGTYAIARSFSFGSQGSTATATTDFALIQNVTLTVPANMASGTVTFPFTAVDDMETEGAETLTIRTTLLPPGGVGRDQTLAVAEAILTINDPAPMGTAPVFTNMASFASAISVPENTVAAGVANFFAAPGTGTTNLTLGGADVTRFTLSAAGTLTFDTAPDFEMPRGMAFDASTNTNNYALTVTAANAFGSVMSGAITVRVTDENESPVLAAFTLPTFTEYSGGTYTFTATDEDTGQTLTYALNAPNHGATLSSTGTFTWTPGEDDGGEARTFSVTVTDDGATPMTTNGMFTITAMELDNRAPIGAAITVAGSATSVTNPDTLGVSAAATDPDTGTTLTYTWSAAANGGGDGGTFSPATGTSTTWTPPTVTSATPVVLTVTVSDGDATMPMTTTATQNVMVNPAPVAPAFTNMGMFTTPIEAAENQTAAGAANFFAAPGTAPVSLTLGGTDAGLFTLTDSGTLTFNDAPNFEMPRGTPVTGTNTNDYALTVTAMNSVDSVASGAIIVRVTDANDAPVFPSFTPPAFEEYTETTFDITATDEDSPAQTLSYSFVGPNHGATLTGGTFTWMPGEADGGETRTFNVRVTDDGSPLMLATGSFDITVTERPNQAPTGATITAAATLTAPNTITLMASATDPDTDTTLTYTWAVTTADGGTIAPLTGASTTYTPPALTEGAAARMIVITVTASDDATPALTDTDTHTVTVNPPVPVGTAPVFTNMASFATAITVPENTSAAGAANFFVAVGTAPVTLTLGGADATRFAITDGGTLTFATAPDFEMPRGMAFDADTNTNNYTLTISAMNSVSTVESGTITVTVTDENEAPVLPAITTTTTFVEYTAGSFDITATDVDRPGQTLAFALTGETHGATLSSTGTFTWTPGEDDGGEARTFSVTVTDSATPPLMTTGTFDITAMELPNRAPTGATLTVAGSATSVTNPDTLGLSAAATDPDTGTTLTYTWSSDATGGSFSPATGTSTTWTPPTVMAAITVTLTVTITDSTDGSVMATQNVMVNPMPVTPVFDNPDTLAFTVVEGTTAVGDAGQFFATGTGAVTLTLGGADMSFFTLTNAGTLTFNAAPDFEMPRGMALSGTNQNNFPLTVVATASGLSSAPVSFLVRVTNANEAPVLDAISLPAFTEYMAGTFEITATDVDDGDTLAYTLNAPNHGATITTGGTFTWTPGEDDGTVVRTFSVTVTDDGGTPPMSASTTFDITAVERPNQAPTGATITAAAALTAPDTITLEATAMDADTGTTLTYAWAVTTADGGTIAPTTGASATYTPPTLATGDAVRMIEIMLTASDGTLTDTDTHTVTVNPPVPVGTAPVFTNLAMFTTAISVAENTVAAGGPNFFAAPGTGATSLMLDGEDSAVFAITDGGTLTFNTAPDFEMPRNGAPAADNTNDYALTVTATNAFGSVMSGAITVRVTDVNEAPVLPEITSPTNFVEYSPGTFNIPFSDPDAGTVLTVSLTPPAHGATLATDGTFTWTPGEDDGGVARTFTVAIADDGSPMMSVTRDFTITATELDNRAPTGATITGGTAVTSPATITLEATAMDADTGTTLTYTWSSDATGDSFDPATGTSTVWTPPVLTSSDAVVTAVIMVTVSDGALTDTDTHTVTVNPPAPVGTAPAFTNDFTSPIEAAENQTGAGVANFFAAPGSGTVTLALGGTDMALFDITDEGTLTFNDAPNFEMPRGMPISGPNPNDYALTVTATNSFGSAQSGPITVRVTDANDAPVLPSFTPTGFTEYSTGTLTLAATDEDLPAQMLTYTLTGEARGATISGNVFTWTPGEADGGEVRQFGVTVTDDGTPPRMVVSAFNITAVELLNRAPTGAAITAAASVNNPNGLPVSAEATDPDTGDMLTYTWSSSTTGDSFSPATGASVTWTPPTVTAATMVTLTVTITDTTNGSVTAMQVVTVNPEDTAPDFAGATIAAQTYTQGTAITAITLPEATGGNDGITYTLAPALPAGLTYTAADRTITGTPTGTAAATTFTLTAADGDANTVADDTATLTFTITVEADSDPIFRTAIITAQTYTQNRTITPVTLPAATGGNAPITYTLTPAIAGLTLNPSTRVLTGTPTTAAEATMYTYTATDRDGDTMMLMFSITVEENTTTITTALNEMILPEVTRALVNSTAGSITRRVGQAVGSAPPVLSFNFAGQSMGGQDNLAAALRTHGEAMSEDSRDIKEMLAGSEFVLPLNPTNTGGGSAVALWGSGDYRDFSGESGDLDWDGDLSGFQVGLDARLRNDLLVGVAVSLLESDIEFEDDRTDTTIAGHLGQGDYELDMTSAHPYIGRRSGGADWWVTAGFGEGELEITEQDANGVSQTPVTSDINMQTFGVGGSVSLQTGTNTLRLKGEVAQTQLEVEGEQTAGGTVDELEVDASRIRVAMEVGRSRKLDGGGVFEPSLEIAARYDGGDGETGGGVEVGGGLRYDGPTKRFTADSRIRALVGQGGDYEEWGVSGTLRVVSGADGQGLSFSVSPGYGISGSGIQELWRQGLADDDAATTTDATDNYAMRLDGRVGYGFGFTLNEHHGVLTPYSEMTRGATDSYRMGVNWKTGTRFDLTLLGERRQPSTAPVEHAVLLKGEIRF